ncbi:MAG: hypothetical protein JRD93_17960 [Deltaproteobacteria bacterium]|nr:hypothetical protein [Deltaproteobacteria bacterium]
MPPVPDWLRNFLVSDSESADTGQTVINNLENDGTIRDQTWNNFCRDMQDAINKSPTSVEETFNCISEPYSLHGPQAQLPKSITVLNRMISEERFIGYFLARNHYPGAYPETINTFLSLPLESQRQQLKNCSLGKGECVWACFSEPREGQMDPDPVDDPRVQDNAVALWRLLGLECTITSETNLVRLRYPRDDKRRELVPLTISAGFTKCFQPSDSQNALHGWTYDPRNQKKGFPEVVHKNLLGDSISDKVRLVKVRAD